MIPENPDVLTPEQKRKSLRPVNLIKEKLCGKIKGQTCADGSNQRGYINREDASSPTISIDILMYTFVVDAYEGRDVTIFDVPGAHLNSDIPDEKYDRIKLDGEFVDIMYNVNPDHIQNIRYENGKKVIHLRIMNP